MANIDDYRNIVSKKNKNDYLLFIKKNSILSFPAKLIRFICLKLGLLFKYKMCCQDEWMVGNNVTSGIPYAFVKKDSFVEINIFFNFLGEINKQDLTGMTKLMCAVCDGDEKAVNELIADGANLNIQDSAGWTALHYAAHNGKANIVRILLAVGAHTKIIPTLGYKLTPYQMACSQRNWGDKFIETIKAFHESNNSKSTSADGKYVIHAQKCLIS